MTVITRNSFSMVNWYSTQRASNQKLQTSSNAEKSKMDVPSEAKVEKTYQQVSVPSTSGTQSESGRISSFVSNVKATVKDSVQNARESIVTIAQNVRESAISVGETVKSTADDVKTTLNQSRNNISDQLTTSAKNINQSYSNIQNNGANLKEAARNMVGAATNIVSTGVKTSISVARDVAAIKGSITEGFKQAGSALKNGEGLVGKAKGVYQGFQEFANVKEPYNRIPNTLSTGKAEISQHIGEIKSNYQDAKGYGKAMGQGLVTISSEVKQAASFVRTEVTSGIKEVAHNIGQGIDQLAHGRNNNMVGNFA